VRAASKLERVCLPPNEKAAIGIILIALERTARAFLLISRDHETGSRLQQEQNKTNEDDDDITRPLIQLSNRIESLDSLDDDEKRQKSDAKREGEGSSITRQPRRNHRPRRRRRCCAIDWRNTQTTKKRRFLPFEKDTA